jgi:hypothetical protein
LLLVRAQASFPRVTPGSNHCSRLLEYKTALRGERRVGFQPRIRSPLRMILASEPLWLAVIYDGIFRINHTIRGPPLALARLVAEVEVQSDAAEEQQR